VKRWAKAKRIPAAPPPSPYEADFYLWCFEQAENLRQGRFAMADLPNIIEELESMGREQRYKLESSYRLIIAHLLKWQYQPQLRSSSWEITIVRERANVMRRERDAPSLRAQARQLVESVYPDARKEAQIETGLPLSTLPAECPYSLDQLRDPDWLPAGASDMVDAPARRTVVGRRRPIIRRSPK
jgi:hypothetical protein